MQVAPFLPCRCCQTKQLPKQTQTRVSFPSEAYQLSKDQHRGTTCRSVPGLLCASPLHIGNQHIMQLLLSLTNKTPVSLASAPYSGLLSTSACIHHNSGSNSCCDLQQRSEKELRKVVTADDAPVALRLVIHDAATFDVATGKGGLNGSIINRSCFLVPPA